MTVTVTTEEIEDYRDRMECHFREKFEIAFKELSGHLDPMINISQQSLIERVRRKVEEHAKNAPKFFPQM